MKLFDGERHLKMWFRAQGKFNPSLGSGFVLLALLPSATSSFEMVQVWYLSCSEEGGGLQRWFWGDQLVSVPNSTQECKIWTINVASSIKKRWLPNLPARWSRGDGWLSSIPRRRGGIKCLENPLISLSDAHKGSFDGANNTATFQIKFNHLPFDGTFMDLLLWLCFYFLLIQCASSWSCYFTLIFSPLRRKLPYQNQHEYRFEIMLQTYIS